MDLICIKQRKTVKYNINAVIAVIVKKAEIKDDTIGALNQ